MKRVLILSSFVARGGIGLSANIAPLQAAGVAAIPLPTTLLSNNPSDQPVAGGAVSPDLMVAMASALDGNGWLADVDAVLTGYMPSAAHVAAARTVVEMVRARNARALFLCDPIAGDDPDGLYVDASVATAIRDDLLGIADVVTPNRFELELLSGRPVADIEDAVGAARSLGCVNIVATSIPSGGTRLANVAVAADSAIVADVERRPSVPHGTGDLFAGLLLAQILAGEPLAAALAHATGGVGYALEGSEGNELRLAGFDWQAGVRRADVRLLS